MDPAVLFTKIDLEFGYWLFNRSTRDLSLRLNINDAAFCSSTHDPFVPQVAIEFGVQPIRPIPTCTNFLAPLSYKDCPQKMPFKSLLQKNKINHVTLLHFQTSLSDSHALSNVEGLIT